MKKRCLKIVRCVCVGVWIPSLLFPLDTAAAAVAHFYLYSMMMMMMSLLCSSPYDISIYLVGFFFPFLF